MGGGGGGGGGGRRVRKNGKENFCNLWQESVWLVGHHLVVYLKKERSFFCGFESCSKVNLCKMELF